MSLLWLVILTSLSLAAWSYLVWFNGNFWRIPQDVDEIPTAPDQWPAVTAIVPARNEQQTIEAAISSLVEQDYAGEFRIVVIDDRSEDGTGMIIDALVKRSSIPIVLIEGSDTPVGWTGKLWALQQGIEQRSANNEQYFWFTDADIVHGEQNLTRLVSRAVQQDRGLVSQMVMLRCETWHEKLLIPAFVYFFCKLYPFARVNRPASRIAAAAGGSILISRDKLATAGGLAKIRGEIIDDCSLAALIKSLAPIRLDLTTDARSIRPYDKLADIWNMVSRTAFVQLRYSTLLVCASVFGMLILYVTPPTLLGITLATGQLEFAIIGILALSLMAATYIPMLRFYGLSAWWVVSLPLAGLMYTLMTIDSARQYLSAASPDWKGRRYNPK